MILMTEQARYCASEILTICCNRYEMSNRIGLNPKREKINRFLLFLEHTHISNGHDLGLKDRFNISSFKSNQM